MKNKRYHDNLRKNLSISGDDATFFVEYQAQKLATWFPTQRNAAISILDFGCGDGLMTSFVQHLFVNATITGIDIDAERIALAKDMHEGVTFVCTDIENGPPFWAASFDLIYTAEVFHHLPREKQAHYIALLMQLLKPGGTLIIFELNPLNLATRYRFKNDPDEKNAQLLMPRCLKQLLKPYGQITTHFYDFFPNALHRLRVLEPYLSWLPLSALYAVSVIKK